MPFDLEAVSICIGMHPTEKASEEAATKILLKIVALLKLCEEPLVKALLDSRIWNAFCTSLESSLGSSLKRRRESLSESSTKTTRPSLGLLGVRTVALLWQPVYKPGKTDKNAAHR